MSEEMSGKSFSIFWLFWPGLILIFIGLISILNWGPEEPEINTNPRVVKEYTPPTPKKPIYQPLPNKPKTKSNLQPLPKDKPEAKPNLQPLPDDKPKIPKPNLQPLPKEKPKRLKSNYQPLKEVGK